MAKLTNLYCPPQSSKAYTDLRLATEIIPTEDNSIVAGEFNAHSIIWDPHVAPNQRGSQVEDWMLDNDHVCHNDGFPTRVNKATGNVSAPDITFCGNLWANKTSWHTLSDLGDSDHSAILIEVNVKTSHAPVFLGPAKWKTKDVDWTEFQQAVENVMPSIPP